jgi:hypothetical protein
MSRALRAGLVLLAVAAVTVLAPRLTSATGGIRAVMSGQPITLKAAERLSCHDFDYPILTCFETSAEMEKAAAERSAARAKMTAASSGYIVVFEHGTYAGTSRTLSQSYSYLGDIGFNDKISSFKSYGATGRFWEHAPPGGLIYFFYSTTRVSYVGDSYNDKFSAIDLY